jgi:signal transduction histidine kinase
MPEGGIETDSPTAEPALAPSMTPDEPGSGVAPSPMTPDEPGSGVAPPADQQGPAASVPADRHLAAGDAPAATDGTGAAPRDHWSAPDPRTAAALTPPPSPRFTPDGLPKLTRRPEGAIVGGVAGGIADHLRVPVLWVRVSFALLAVMAGAGVLAYALLWIFVPQGPSSLTEQPRPATQLERRQAYGIAAVGVALLIVATALGFGEVLTWVLGPLGLAAIGAAFIWREADEARRARWRRTAAGIVGPTNGSWWRLVGGCLLVVGGLSVFALGQLDFTAVRSALIAVVLTLVGVAIITIPWWLRLIRDLGDERRGRIQERERAEIAAHLHDSVLQTLALIQRQAGDSREVQRLARSQERQLRTWLYGPAGYAAAGQSSAPPSRSLAAALAEVAGEVEDAYAISVTPVIVGDATMDQHLAALVAAAREAMVNAAKHAQVQEISVYAEVEDGKASVFVRDRGVGFDQKDVATDRRGLAESIRGRMERHGGTATVRSRPGEGTEVELVVTVSTDADDADAGSPFAAAGAASAPAEAGDPATGEPHAADSPVGGAQVSGAQVGGAHLGGAHTGGAHGFRLGGFHSGGGRSSAGQADGAHSRGTLTNHADQDAVGTVRASADARESA